MHIQFMKRSDTGTRTDTVSWVQSQDRWTLDTHMNRQLHTIVPGLTTESHQRLLRPRTWVRTKTESATQDTFIGGCQDIEWWTHFTDKKKSGPSPKWKKSSQK